MHNPEQVTRDSRLIDVFPGVEVRIARLEAGARAVSAEGLVPGAVISVERRVRLGGPVIVRLGRARLALARAVAREIVVAAIHEPAE